jgi:formylglycine-generating enzyme required for sulfatase activity
MVAVEAGPRTLEVQYRLRETGLYGSAPFYDEWKPLPPRLHRVVVEQRHVNQSQFAISVKEVTNGDIAGFLDDAKYWPVRPERFLAHWRGGVPPPGTENQPVTFINLEDARAYARWSGQRLPTEDEWQLAALAGLLKRARPEVWEWTESEHSDGRTRFAILKGGCAFRADGSDWYLDGGVQPPEVSVKLLLCGAGLDRSATIGFRCAVDMQ